MGKICGFFLVSQYLRTVSRYESRDKYRDASMNRADTTEYSSVIPIPAFAKIVHIGWVGLG